MSVFMVISGHKNAIDLGYNHQGLFKMPEQDAWMAERGIVMFTSWGNAGRILLWSINYIWQHPGC
jgi:hypothetical protein